MITFRIADKNNKNDLDRLISIRLEMLKIVNNLDENYEFDKNFIEEATVFFNKGNATNILAMDGDKVIGCASLVYMYLMPTFCHPTGKRAHLMNVYTNSNYRRQGIGKKMCQLLIDEAKQNGITEISLDATKDGRPLYESLGFEASESGMTINL